MPQYVKTVWVNGTVPALNDSNLNKMEQGIFDAFRQDGSTTMSGQLVTTAGSFATPAIAPTGDSNTGIFFPAADTISFGTVGSERMRITSAGNVGIGTTVSADIIGQLTTSKTSAISAQTSVAITGALATGSAGHAILWKQHATYTTGYISCDAVGGGTGTGLIFATANTFGTADATEKMRIMNTGNVGIGTTNPTNKLQIDGVTANTSCINAIANTTTGQSFGIALSAGTNSTDYALNVRNAAQTSQLFHITGAGNIGIGTTSPDVFSRGYSGTILGISSSGQSAIELNSGTGNKAFIDIGVAGTRQGYLTGSSTEIELGSATAIPLYLITNNNIQATITSAGNVGIGTTSPSYTLDANGIVRAKNAFYIGRSTDSAVIGSVKEGTSNGLKIQAESGGTDSTITFATNGGDRAIITSAGNVGIGTTPSNWGSGYTALSIKNAGNSISSSGASQLLLSSNAYDSGAGAWKYNDNGYFANLMEIGSNGYLFYTTQSTQGAGNPITWSERMRITSAGYLLIGYTSSNGAYPLQVNGQIFATSSTIATSDGRYKKDVVSLDGALDIVKALNPVQFSWKDHPVHKFNTDVPTVGFIAQEVEQALANKSYLTSIIKKSECTWEIETGETIEREVTRDVEKQVEREITEEIDGEEVTRTVTETVIEQVTEIVTEPVKETHTEEFLGIAESNLIAILTKAVKELTAKVEALEAQLNGN